MLNPFIQDLPPRRKSLVVKNRQLTAEQHTEAVEDIAPHPAPGLWLGKLLIRMGEKLTKQNIELKGTKQSA